MATLRVELLVEEEAARLRKLFAETKEPRFKAAADALAKKARRGRRPEPDRDLLYQMAQLLKRGTVKQPYTAARRVAASAKRGHSREATAKRLDAKFKKERVHYFATLSVYEARQTLDRIYRSTAAVRAQFDKMQAEAKEAMERSGLAEAMRRAEADMVRVQEQLGVIGYLDHFSGNSPI